MNYTDLLGTIAFLNKSEGPAADSLRRCIKAWGDNNPHRKTPEFDALIQLK